MRATREELHMTRFTLAVFILATVACGAGAPPAGPTTPTTSTPLSYTLSGEVFENVAGTKQPVAGAGIYLWGVPCAIVLPGHNCITWYGAVTGHDPVSDGDGRYVAPDVPLRQVSIIVGKAGYVQPCAATGYAQNAGVDVELVSMASLNTASPLPLMTNGVRVVGTVFEMTPDGARGVAGAFVDVETEPDLAVATTMTDLTGHFTMCNVFSGSLYVGKAGYAVSAGTAPKDGMAIELMPNPASSASAASRR